MVNDRGLMTNGEILRHSFELVSSSAVPIIIAGLCLFPVDLADSIWKFLEATNTSGMSGGNIRLLVSTLTDIFLFVPYIIGLIWLSRWTAGRTQGEQGVSFFEDGMGFTDIARFVGVIGIEVLVMLLVLALPIGLAQTRPDSTIVLVAGVVAASPFVFCVGMFALYAGSATVFHGENPIAAITTSIRLVRGHKGETFALLVLYLTCHAVLSRFASEHSNPDTLLAALSLRFANCIVTAFCSIFLSIKYLSLRPLNENDARVNPDMSVAE